MSDDSLLDRGLETRDVRPGWVAVVHHGDGTSTEYWGPTERIAKDRARRGEDDA